MDDDNQRDYFKDYNYQAQSDDEDSDDVGHIDQLKSLVPVLVDSMEEGESVAPCSLHDGYFQPLHDGYVQPELEH